MVLPPRTLRCAFKRRFAITFVVEHPTVASAVISSTVIDAAILK